MISANVRILPLRQIEAPPHHLIPLGVHTPILKELLTSLWFGRTCCDIRLWLYISILAILAELGALIYFKICLKDK